MQGRTIENKGVMYLLLALFGFPIIADCIMQSDFNKLATGTGSAAFPRVDDVALTLERYARMCDRGGFWHLTNGRTKTASAMRACAIAA